MGALVFRHTFVPHFYRQPAVYKVHERRSTEKWPDQSARGIRNAGLSQVREWDDWIKCLSISYIFIRNGKNAHVSFETSVGNYFISHRAKPSVVSFIIV